MFVIVSFQSCAASLPARGAWIEIPILSYSIDGRSVAPREGSVD